MLRFLFAVLQIGLILAVVAYVGQFDGSVEVDIGGYVVEFSLLAFSVAVVILLAVLILVIMLVGGLRRIPGRWRQYRIQSRRETGYRALTRGMVAVAAGEKLSARKAAAQAEKLLQEPPLTMLLSAQSAQLDGDEKAAEKYFNQMLKHPEMAFLGWRGLIMQALRGNDLDRASQLIEMASAKFPRQEWLIDQSLQLSQRRGEIGKALTLVQQGARVGMFSRGEARQREAALHLERGLEHQAQGNWSQAGREARKAWKIISRDLGSASLAKSDLAYRCQHALAKVATGLEEQGDAEKAIRQCLVWRGDHESLKLADDYGDGRRLAGLERWRVLRPLFPDELNGVLCHYLCRLALEAELYGEAKKLLDGDPDADSLGGYQMRLGLARAENDPDQIAHWLKKIVQLNDREYD